jgi:nucleotide-binding universal stress UspA family protein
MGEIVVGIDGSQGSQLALRWALDQAARRGDMVRAVHAFGPGRLHWGESPPPEVEVRRAAQRIADEAVRSALAATPVDVRVETEIVAANAGGAARVLVAYSRRADLLVVGSRGLGGFAGLMVGSVSEQCVTHALCPVVVIPAAERVGTLAEAELATASS